VLYNSWEATTFDVNERSQSELAEIAAEIGWSFS
jgi:alpha-galactosidase